VQDWPLVWFPILGENRSSQLQRVATEIPKSAEICPILPHPSRDPRRADRLIIEYKEPLFDSRRTPTGNILYAHESNPFEAYRQLFLAMQRYRDSLNIMGGSKKTACGCCGRTRMGWYDRKVRRVRDLSCGDTRIVLELEVRRVDCRRCGSVKRERLDFLADNPLYTKRFWQCEAGTARLSGGQSALHQSALLTLSAGAAGGQDGRRGTARWRHRN
jgi:hypothetical protein